MAVVFVVVKLLLLLTFQNMPAADCTLQNILGHGILILRSWSVKEMK